MTTFEILVATYMAVVPAALGALFWSRLNQIESKLDHIASTYVTRDEFNAAMSEFRAEVNTALSEFRAEFHADLAESRAESRQDIGNLRSDVTHIALAVGARPRASEG